MKMLPSSLVDHKVAVTTFKHCHVIMLQHRSGVAFIAPISRVQHMQSIVSA
jgi:hypothetical protein